jgi:hypothetical protein
MLGCQVFSGISGFITGYWVNTSNPIEDWQVKELLYTATKMCVI